MLKGPLKWWILFFLVMAAVIIHDQSRRRIKDGVDCTNIKNWGRQICEDTWRDGSGSDDVKS
jgi:hypothetical protein